MTFRKSKNKLLVLKYNNIYPLKPNVAFFILIRKHSSCGSRRLKIDRCDVRKKIRAYFLHILA